MMGEMSEGSKTSEGEGQIMKNGRLGELARRVRTKLLSVPKGLNEGKTRTSQ